MHPLAQTLLQKLAMVAALAFRVPVVAVGALQILPQVYQAVTAALEPVVRFGLSNMKPIRIQLWVRLGMV